MTHLFGKLGGQSFKLSTAAIIIRFYESPIGDHQGTTKGLFYSYICSYCTKQTNKKTPQTSEKCNAVRDSVKICKLSNANTHNGSSTPEALLSEQ